MEVLEAIKNRRSVRAFLSTTVSKKTIIDILEVAHFAPSGVNTQPWKIIVVGSAAREKIALQIGAARENKIKENPDYNYYPQKWHEPYLSRRKACGLALYSALGIGFEETVKRKEAWHRNYNFFGAPVGLILAIDHQLEKGSWMDCAMFMQNILLAARGYGLETCSQAALAEYPDIIRSVLALPYSQKIICGIALGYADWDHPLNQYRTAREPIDTFTKWID